jgi:hypothetical protein
MEAGSISTALFYPTFFGSPKAGLDLTFKPRNFSLSMLVSHIREHTSTKNI